MLVTASYFVSLEQQSINYRGGMPAVLRTQMALKISCDGVLWVDRQRRQSSVQSERAASWTWVTREESLGVRLSAVS